MADSLHQLDALATHALSGSVRIAAVEGAAGVGKSTLLRRWAARRDIAGDVVVFTRCGELDAAQPLEALLVALGMSVPDGLPPLADYGVEPTALYAAVLDALRARAGSGLLALIVDDAHYGGAALGAWLRYFRQQSAAAIVVLSTEAGDASVLPADLTLSLTGGPEPSPEVAVRRCAELGPAARTIRAAAVVGPAVDADVVAAVLDRPVGEVREHLKAAVEAGLVTGDGEFSHVLVRSALAATVEPTRVRDLHRQAARVLDADPVVAAWHARLGGDATVAGETAKRAARRAAGRRDYATAEALLDQAVEGGAAEAHRDRAWVRTLRGRFAAAQQDVAQAGAAGAEVGAWAAYYDRRFDRAMQLADAHPVIGGRVHHAAGNLTTAERLLTDALEQTTGADRVTAAAWLGCLRVHRNRLDEAVELMADATHGEHASSALHATLFTGLAHALAGRPAEALTWFDRYSDEVQRRHAPRFAGRGLNASGWVLRNIGAVDEGLDRHHRALELAGRTGATELAVAALEDIADDALLRGDVDRAARRVEEAESSLVGDVVFGWRLSLRLRLLQGRVALARGDAASALTYATTVTRRAEELGVPRYRAFARLLAHRARFVLGNPAELEVVGANLDDLDQTAGLEAWHWTARLAEELRVPAWRERAVERMKSLAGQCGDRAGAFEIWASGHIPEA